MWSTAHDDADPFAPLTVPSADMTRVFRRLLACALLLLAAVGPHPSRAAPAPQSSIVVDASTGDVLASSDPTALWRPASLTKLMTLYITFEELAAGRLKLADILTVSPYAAAMPPTELGLSKGEKITVETAILGTITRSANDAAVVLAERIGGDETSFAGRMTATAKRLGMTGSNFHNATGLPDPEQTTTARDMALLARALIRDFPQYYHFFSARSMSYLSGSLASINAILYLYPGADGLKTGFTCSSGYNLVASAVHDGTRIIGVLLGGLSNDQRFGGMRVLLDRGFATEGKPGADPTVIDKMTDAGNAPPPQQLSAEACTPGWSLEPDGMVAGRLPGWGILFGGFPKPAPTQALLQQSVKLLPVKLKAGKPAVVARQYKGFKAYRAVVVGLTGAQAAAMCHHLGGAGHYCRALSPAELNNPKALWR
jgi:D-alanyl-D-alanine carboxypeptidase